MNKKVFLRTFGCQMNESDSEVIKSILSEAGYEFATSEEEADIILLNTCSVRDNAQRKVKGLVHYLRHKLLPKIPVIGILGCIASHEKEIILKDKDFHADLVAGPDSYKKLPELIETAMHRRKAFDVELSDIETYADIYPKRKTGVNAWISVMRGCNNFCAFCVVPYTRGRERSRSPQSVIEEAQRLASEGFLQVTLLGQNVNSYNYEGVDFADLLEQISRIDGIKRIRFTSPHPKDFPKHLIEVVAKNPKICKQIHLPLQAGNDRVLQMMNRNYTQEQYLSLVNEIRQACPTIALSTDIIIGFPTETAEEFEDTVDVMHKVKFDSAFIFKYSPREGTLASRKYPDDVPEAEKTKRIVKLNEIQKAHSLAANSNLIGQTLEVLIEQQSTTKSENELTGRSDGNKLVIISNGPHFRGDSISVTITGASANILRGKPI